MITEYWSELIKLCEASITAHFVLNIVHKLAIGRMDFKLFGIIMQNSNVCTFLQQRLYQLRLEQYYEI